MSTINRQPLGLLGFLGIKNSGKYPADLNPGLNPVWDLSELYLANPSEYVQVSMTANTVGNQATVIQVPNGEVWWVSHAGVRSATLIAAEFLNLSLTLASANNTALVPISEQTADYTVGSRAHACLMEPLYMNAGEQLVAYANRIATAGTIGLTMTARITRLRA